MSLATGAVGATQLTIADSQFGTAANQIILNAPIATVLISDNLIYVTTGNTGILIETSGQVDASTFTGNSFNGSSTTGSTAIDVLSSSTSTTSVITGNIFNRLAVGVNLVGATRYNVQANIYTNVTSAVINIGSTNLVGVATE